MVLAPPADPRQWAFEDHPASLTMAQALHEDPGSDPLLLTDRDSRGWTALHHHALGGNLAIVRAMLDAAPHGPATAGQRLTWPGPCGGPRSSNC